MLFYGPPGTGKTTTIRVIANEMYENPRLNVLELNASDDRGIQIVRENIKSFASTTSSGLKKLIILDEADSMSRDAQNALRRVIEDFTTNARFCLIANYSNKIIPAILSRCCKFRFSPVVSGLEKRILDVCSKEGIVIDEGGLETLLELSSGDLRKLMNDLEGLASSFSVINRENVLSFNGSMEENALSELFKDLCSLKFEELRERINCMVDRHSLDCIEILNSMTNYVRSSEMKNRMVLLNQFAEIEYRLSLGCSQNMQLMALAGAFIKYRN